MNRDPKQCTGSKTGWVHQVHSLSQPARPGAPRPRARRSCRGHALAMSWPCGRPCHSLAWPCRRPRRPCRGRVPRAGITMSWPRSRHSACLMLPPWSQYTTVYCDTTPQQPGPSCHDTIMCIVTQPPPRPNQPSSPPCHDTIPIVS